MKNSEKNVATFQFNSFLQPDVDRFESVFKLLALSWQSDLWCVHVTMFSVFFNISKCFAPQRFIFTKSGSKKLNRLTNKKYLQIFYKRSSFLSLWLAFIWLSLRQDTDRTNLNCISRQTYIYGFEKLRLKSDLFFNHFSF